jgi:hypothetical protein
MRSPLGKPRSATYPRRRIPHWLSALFLMRKLIGCTLLIAVAAAAGGYAYWTEQRDVGHYLSDLRVELAINDGVDTGRGNLLGIEPDAVTPRLSKPGLVHLKLAAYLNSARDAGLLNDKTVVVLPEHIGSWLMFEWRKNELYQAANLNEAMHWLAISNPLAFANAWLRADGESRTNDAHLRMKARSMAARLPDAVRRPGQRIWRDPGGWQHRPARPAHRGRQAAAGQWPAVQQQRGV